MTSLTSSHKPLLPCVLTIAGTDPSGGAGIQADIKTISATACYAASVITVLVAQNTQGVQAIQEVPIAFIRQQLDAVLNDMQLHAIKIGLLHNIEIIQLIAEYLNKKLLRLPVVLDPVMIAQSGDRLLKKPAILALTRLFPLVSLITPNLPESEVLLQKKIPSKSVMQQAAITLAHRYDCSVLLKGGHLNEEKSEDVLYNKKTDKLTWFSQPRIQTDNTHGTGCTLSSAIASYLAQANGLEEAINLANEYVHHALQGGCKLNLGKGSGPVHHFYYHQPLSAVVTES